jgi:carbamoyl-phosphate synthase large subunit
MRTILVTGASGVVGYGVLRSLRKSGKALLLVGTTIYEDSVAPGFCDIFERAPLTADAGYLDWLVEVVRKHNVDLVIPGIEADVYRCADGVDHLRRHAVNVLLNTLDLIALCRDKWAFYQALQDGLANYAIPSSIDADFEKLEHAFGLPFLLKPRRGFGSKGIVRINDAQAFAAHREQVGSLLMAQPIVGSDEAEYSCSAFCDGEGGFYASMTLKRRLSKDGFTEKAEVATVEGMDDAVAALCKKFRPIGPTNFQFRRQDGAFKLLEINPRTSSATSIRTAFGYNESAMAVDFFLENKPPVQPTIRQGRAVRYMEDFIFYEDRPDL